MRNDEKHFFGSAFLNEELGIKERYALIANAKCKAQNAKCRGTSCRLYCYHKFEVMRSLTSSFAKSEWGGGHRHRRGGGEFKLWLVFCWIVAKPKIATQFRNILRSKIYRFALAIYHTRQRISQSTRIYITPCTARHMVVGSSSRGQSPIG